MCTLRSQVFTSLWLQVLQTQQHSSLWHFQMCTLLVIVFTSVWLQVLQTLQHSSLTLWHFQMCTLCIEVFSSVFVCVCYKRFIWRGWWWWLLLPCGQLLSPSNVATYGALCALASFDRQELQVNVIASRWGQLQFFFLPTPLRLLVFCHYVEYLPTWSQLYRKYECSNHYSPSHGPPQKEQ